MGLRRAVFQHGTRLSAPGFEALAVARWMLCHVPDLHAALPMTTGPRDVAGRFDPDALAGLSHRCFAILRDG